MVIALPEHRALNITLELHKSGSLLIPALPASPLQLQFTLDQKSWLACKLFECRDSSVQAVTPSLGSAAGIQPTKLSQPVHPIRARVLIPTGQPASQPSTRCLTHREHRAYDAPHTGSRVKMR